MKEMQFKILITAGMDGSLTGAIAKATSGLNRLKSAASGKVNFGENLSEKLKELKQAQTSLERMKTLMRSGSGTASGLSGLKEATLEVTRLRAALRSMRESGATKLEIKGVKDQLKWTEQNLKTAYANYGKQISELRQLQAALATAGVKAGAFGDAEMKLRRTLDAANKALEAQKRLSEAYKAHNDGGTNFNTAWDNMSNAVATAQSVMSPVIGATQTAMRYEAELSRSRALTQMDNINRGRTGVIEREMTMLDERYKEIGRTTRYSAIEAERAGNYLAMAGFTAEQINAGLKSMVNLGIANNTELDRTADIFSNIATSMRIEQTVEGYQKLADRTTYLTTHSNQTLTMLDDTMKYVAPIASALKIDIDDLYSAQKFMVDSGVRGSMAGTALKSFLLRSIAPPKKAMEALAEAGIMTPEEMNQNAAFQEMMMEAGIDINARQGDESVLMSLIRQYSEKSKDWSESRKTSFIEAWAGKYAAPGVMAMLENGGYQKILEFNKGLKGSDGAAAQTAGVMNDNLQGSWLGLQSAMESASIEVGAAFLPAARSVTESLTGIVRSMATFAANNPVLIQGLGLMATFAATAAVSLGAFRVVMAGINFAQTTVEMLKATAALRVLGGAGGVIGGLTAKVGALGEIFKTQGLIAGLKTLGYAFKGAFTAAAGFLFSPWGAALAALAAGAYMIYSNWDKLAPFFEGLWSQITSSFERAGAIISPALSRLTSAFDVVKGALKNAFGGDAGVEELMSKLSALGDVASKVCLGLVMTLAEVFAGLISMAAPAIAGVVALFADMGSGVIEVLTKLFSGDFGGALTALKNAFVRVCDDVKNIFKGLLEGLLGMFNKIGGIFKGLRDGSILNGTFDWESLMEFKAANRYEGTVSATVEREAQSTASATPLTERLITELRAQSKEQVSDGRGQEQYLTAVQQALSTSTALSMEQQQAVLTGVTNALESRFSMMEQLTSRLSEAKAETLPEQASFVEAIGALMDKQSDRGEALQTAIEYIKGREDISTKTQEALIGQLREIFSKPKEETKDADVTRSLDVAARSMDVASRSMSDLPSKIQAAAQHVAAKQVEAGVSNVKAPLMEAPPSVEAPSIGNLQMAMDGAALSTTAFNGQMMSSGMATAAFNSQLMMTSGATTAFNGQLMMAGGATTMFGSQLVATSGSTAAFNAGVTNAGASAAGASSAIAGLGGAASSAIGALMSAASSAGSAISAAASSAWSGLTSAVGSLLPGHAEGGIFPRGAHLTWFAEDSAEAAIPLDNSKRSKSLWTQVGEMMGILPTVKETPQPESIMSGSRVKLPFGLKIPPRRRTTPGVPTEVRSPKGKLPEALERYEEVDREMRIYSGGATATNVSEAMTAPITVNITFNGTVDREETKSGVMEGLEAMLERLNHERSRRAYA